MRDPTEHNSPVLNKIGRFWLWLFGWEVRAELPEIPRYVIVGGPHTSNWDFPFGLATFYSLNMKLSWMGKDTLFRPPLGYFMRAIGGIAIDRNSSHGVVDQMVEQFDRNDHLIIGLAAKGTRRKTDYWKSGFYWIAYKAGVPIVCAYLDYEKKLARIGLTLKPTGDVKKDMDAIRRFYEGVVARRPENADNIRLREEIQEN